MSWIPSLKSALVTLVAVTPQEMETFTLLSSSQWGRQRPGSRKRLLPKAEDKQEVGLAYKHARPILSPVLPSFQQGSTS